MDIIYLGHASFRIKGKKAVVITDPFDPKMVGLKYPKVDCDIVTVSHQHKDHNFLESVKGYKFVIQGPGEYEVSGVSITGIKSFHDTKRGEERGKNTIFVIEMDGFKIAHLGDLGHRLDDETLEKMGQIDILMIPTGGFYTINSKVASEVVRDIEPSVTIPMHYKIEGVNEENFGVLEPLDKFLKEVGINVEKRDKLSVDEKEIREEKKTLVLESR